MQLLKQIHKHLHRTAGTLFLLAGATIFMGIITAESYFPAGEYYTTRANDISDLAAKLASTGAVAQPSATIFNLAMIGAGLLVAGGSFFLYRAYGRKPLSILLALFGVGLAGVGLFPAGNSLHALFATLTFTSVGFAAIVSYKILPSPLRYIAVLLGVLALYHLALLSVFKPILGAGGAERWVAYPTLIWLIAFGGFLSASDSSKT